MVPMTDRQTTNEQRRPANRHSPRRTVAGYALAAAGLVATGAGLHTAMNVMGPEPTPTEHTVGVVEPDQNGDGQPEVVLLLPEQGTPEENSVMVTLPPEPTTTIKQ